MVNTFLFVKKANPTLTPTQGTRRTLGQGGGRGSPEQTMRGHISIGARSANVDENAFSEHCVGAPGTISPTKYSDLAVHTQIKLYEP